MLPSAASLSFSVSARDGASVVLVVASDVDDGAREALRERHAAALHIDVAREHDHVDVIARGWLEGAELEVQV